jgi:nicotinate phosphoribosyltransferase
VRAQGSLLLTDLYQLTMLEGYFRNRMEQTAVFEFFVRDLPAGRNFLLAAGLEQVLEFLQQASFRPEELQWLGQTGRFSAEFIDSLAGFRFTGDVHAMAEGTPFFPYEPLLRITAPLPQAQLVESRIINILHLQSLLAAKAARCVLAAPQKLLVDFGLRRAHGAEAGLSAARASYLAGFAGTATVQAGRDYDIPLYGTMAHSFVQAHDDEAEAFVHFAEAQPDNVVLLIDTYDTEAGAHKVVALADGLRQRGIAIKAVRLDSGDLAEHARKVRRILDAGGLKEVRIFSSGDLDEYRLRELLGAGAPIDGFGVGTKLDTSADAPYLDCAYKLMEYAGLARRKKSEGKAIWPGRKQVFRRYDEQNRMLGDTVSLEGEQQPGEALLQPYMKNGERLFPSTPLGQLREYCREQLARLPDSLRRLDKAADYPVTIAPPLRQLAEEVDARLGIG